jgi:hypothetical protein
MSIWTDGLPAWWAMVVAVWALLAGVLLGELHGRGVGRGQVREDRAAERAVRQVRSWRDGRGERTAAFLNPPAVHHEAADPFGPEAYKSHRAGCQCPDCRAEVAHETFLSHAELAMDLANDDPTVSAWTQQMAESMDAFLAGLLAEHPVPYLPGEEER